jgi:hypothetical protein
LQVFGFHPQRGREVMTKVEIKVFVNGKHSEQHRASSIHENKLQAVAAFLTAIVEEDVTAIHAEIVGDER